MKITDIKCHIMNIPRPDGPGLCRNWIFVEVETDEGLTGIGEATTKYHELAVKAQVETELKPRLVGMDPTDIERIWQLGYRDFWWKRGVVHTSAVSGVDQALWDIAGKAAGLPVFKLLGGKVRERVRCYIRYGPEFYGVDRDTAARRSLEMGFDAFKHGWGTLIQPYDGDKQVQVAIKEHSRFREVLGPNVALMIDVVGMFNPQQAHRLIEGLRPLNMLFVEEPTNQDTVEPTLRLKRDFPDVKIACWRALNHPLGFPPVVRGASNRCVSGRHQPRRRHQRVDENRAFCGSLRYLDGTAQSLRTYRFSRLCPRLRGDAELPHPRTLSHPALVRPDTTSEGANCQGLCGCQ